MILEGNERGGAKNLALHLLKSENDHVTVHELRGFMSGELTPALNEIHAISRGTKAKKFMFSLSLNPPPNERVSTQSFMNAIERAEKDLGLSDQPRAIVFHEKNGRRHAHVVWSRIDALNMKAIKIDYYKRKLMDISRNLYIEHGWKMPRGFMNSAERDPKNYTLAQWQQARRTGKHSRDVKAAFQDCWAISDSLAGFKHALMERGYRLAHGRRGYVAVDKSCEVYAVARQLPKGINTKEVIAKFGEPKDLPMAEEAKDQMAKDMQARLTTLQKQRAEAVQDRQLAIKQHRRQMVEQHKTERQKLKEAQEKRWQAETRQRQERFHKGLRGLFDRLTGRRQQIKRQNEVQAYEAIRRDQQERDRLIFQHLEQRRRFQGRIERLENFRQSHSQTLSRDIDQFREIEQKKRESFDFKRSASPPSGRSRSVDNFKARMQNRKHRDGPDRER